MNVIELTERLRYSRYEHDNGIGDEAADALEAQAREIGLLDAAYNKEIRLRVELESRLAAAERECARLKAAWDAAYEQAMQNGAAANETKARLAEAMFILEVCVPILIDSCKQHDKGAIQRWDEARGTRWPRADDSAPLDMVPAPDGSRVLCVADSEDTSHE